MLELVMMAVTNYVKVLVNMQEENLLHRSNGGKASH